MIYHECKFLDFSECLIVQTNEIKSLGATRQNYKPFDRLCCAYDCHAAWWGRTNGCETGKQLHVIAVVIGDRLTFLQRRPPRPMSQTDSFCAILLTSACDSSACTLHDYRQPTSYKQQWPIDSKMSTVDRSCRIETHQVQTTFTSENVFMFFARPLDSRSARRLSRQCDDAMYQTRLYRAEMHSVMLPPLAPNGHGL